MDPVKILKRSWHILWNYRALWVFGLILAMTAAGSSGGNGNSGMRYTIDSSNLQKSNETPQEMQKAFNEAFEELERLFTEGLPATGISQAEITALIVTGAVFMLALLTIGIVMVFARYISETAIISMVDDYENTDSKMTVRQGFGIGWSRTSWRLFLINLIINLPIFLLLAVMAIFGFIIYSISSGSNQTFALAGVISMIGFIFLTIFVVAVVSIVLRLLRQFFWRACTLENVGVRESLRLGYQMVRENWKNVGLMWLIMMGLGIAWILISFIVVVLTLPLVLITSIIAAFVVSIPGLLLVGLFSLFLSGYLPWIVAGVFVLPLFIMLAFSPWVLLTVWQQVFTSSVWTLTYREIKALPALAQEMDIAPVRD